MSMVRLPTRMSDGKANLHKGAIGAGVDMATGLTLTAMWGNEIVAEHSDTGKQLTGLSYQKDFSLGPPNDPKKRRSRPPAAQRNLLLP